MNEVGDVRGDEIERLAYLRRENGRFCDVTDRPGTYMEASGELVEMQDARLAWVPIAREALLRTAGSYNGYITYRDLAEELQNKSGIRTKQLTHHWIGKVLGIVSSDCHRLNEPLLSSLCVQQNGSVGAGYGVALDATYGGPRCADLDLAAAEERLKCYGYFGAQMPEDGGRPTLTPMLVATRNKKATPSRTRAATEDVRGICPLCHVRLPSSGVCGSHD
jgi:hypothetical protein